MSSPDLNIYYRTPIIGGIIDTLIQSDVVVLDDCVIEVVSNTPGFDLTESDVKFSKPITPMPVFDTAWGMAVTGWLPGVPAFVPHIRKTSNTYSIGVRIDDGEALTELLLKLEQYITLIGVDGTGVDRLGTFFVKATETDIETKLVKPLPFKDISIYKRQFSRESNELWDGRLLPGVGLMYKSELLIADTYTVPIHILIARKSVSGWKTIYLSHTTTIDDPTEQQVYSSYGGVLRSHNNDYTGECIHVGDRVALNYVITSTKSSNSNNSSSGASGSDNLNSSATAVYTFTYPQVGATVLLPEISGSAMMAITLNKDIRPSRTLPYKNYTVMGVATNGGLIDADASGGVSGVSDNSGENSNLELRYSCLGVLSSADAPILDNPFVALADVSQLQQYNMQGTIKVAEASDVVADRVNTAIATGAWSMYGEDPNIYVYSAYGSPRFRYHHRPIESDYLEQLALSVSEMADSSIGVTRCHSIVDIHSAEGSDITSEYYGDSPPTLFTSGSPIYANVECSTEASQVIYCSDYRTTDSTYDSRYRQMDKLHDRYTSLFDPNGVQFSFTVTGALPPRIGGFGHSYRQVPATSIAATDMHTFAAIPVHVDRYVGSCYYNSDSHSYSIFEDTQPISSSSWTSDYIYWSNGSSRYASSGHNYSSDLDYSGGGSASWGSSDFITDGRSRIEYVCDLVDGDNNDNNDNNSATVDGVICNLFAANRVVGELGVLTNGGTNALRPVYDPRHPRLRAGMFLTNYPYPQDMYSNWTDVPGPSTFGIRQSLYAKLTSSIYSNYYDSTSNYSSSSSSGGSSSSPYSSRRSTFLLNSYMTTAPYVWEGDNHTLPIYSTDNIETIYFRESHYYVENGEYRCFSAQLSVSSSNEYTYGRDNTYESYYSDYGRSGWDHIDSCNSSQSNWIDSKYTHTAYNVNSSSSTYGWITAELSEGLYGFRRKIVVCFGVSSYYHEVTSEHNKSTQSTYTHSELQTSWDDTTELYISHVDSSSYVNRVDMYDWPYSYRALSVYFYASIYHSEYVSDGSYFYYPYWSGLYYILGSGISFDNNGIISIVSTREYSRSVNTDEAIDTSTKTSNVMYFSGSYQISEEAYSSILASPKIIEHETNEYGSFSVNTTQELMSIYSSIQARAKSELSPLVDSAIAIIKAPYLPPQLESPSMPPAEGFTVNLTEVVPAANGYTRTCRNYVRSRHALGSRSGCYVSRAQSQSNIFAYDFNVGGTISRYNHPVVVVDLSTTVSGLLPPSSQLTDE